MFQRIGYSATTWSIGDLSNWKIQNATIMDHIFYESGYNATTWNIGDISNWDTSKAANMGWMFYNAGKTDTTWELNLEKWNIEKVNDRRGFAGGISEKIKQPKWNNGKTYYVVYSEDDNSLRFYNTKIETGSIHNELTATAVYEVYEKYIFSGTYDIPWFNYRENITKVIFEDEIELSGTAYLFYELKNCVSFNLEKLNKTHITDMTYMFGYAGYNIDTDFELNLSGWDISNVTSTRYMFYHTGYNAKNKFSIDVSGWDTSKLTSANRMFYSAGYNANIFEINISNWSVSELSNIEEMFYQTGYSAENFNIMGLNDWYLKEALNVNRMFAYAGYNADYSLDLSNWTTCKVTIGNAYDGFDAGVENKIIEPDWYKGGCTTGG